MLQTHTRGPPSRGPARPLVLLGAGLLLLLLLLSTCLGQDTDGKSHFFPHTDDPESCAGCPAGIWISEHDHSRFLTGCCGPVSWASQAAESQQEFSDSLLMWDIICWLLWVRPPHGEARSSARTHALLPEWDFFQPNEQRRSWSFFLSYFILFHSNECLLYSP